MYKNAEFEIISREYYQDFVLLHTIQISLITVFVEVNARFLKKSK